MIFIKYMILILIFTGSTWIGILISKKYKSRVLELKQFKESLVILENKIKFTYEPLGDIFNEISEISISNDKIYKIFNLASQKMRNENAKDAWEDSVETLKSNLSLRNDDINIIKGLGKFLR